MTRIIAAIATMAVFVAITLAILPDPVKQCEEIMQTSEYKIAKTQHLMKWEQ